MTNTGHPKLVKSAIRTMELFAAFSSLQRPLTLGELAEALNAPKSSCYELLQTLVHLGYILALDGGRTYYPSRRLWDMTEQISRFNPVKEKIQNALRDLRDTTGETVFIGRLQGTQVVYSEVFDGTHTVRYNASSGDLKSIHASALGKALLASLDTQTQDQLLRRLKLTRFNDSTIVRKKELREELRRCGESGVYTTVGEHLADVLGIAVPVKIQGHLLAIGMAGPIPRMQQNRQAYSRDLLAVADKVQS